MEVRLENGDCCVVVSQPGSVESVRRILIIELLKAEYDNASKSYEALNILISKEGA